MKKNKNVLVIGGAGYIGSHTVIALNEAGYNPIVYDNLSTGHKDAVFTDNFIQGELSNKELIKETLIENEIDSVIHFAALIEAGQSVRYPLLYYRNNVASTISLLEAMYEIGVDTMVFSSTAAVYGNANNAKPLGEELPIQPASPYGKTKAMIESVLTDISEASNMNIVSLRYFNAAGADALARTGERHNPETHLIPLLLQVANGSRPNIAIFGTDYSTNDGTCIRDYVHVTDLATAHVAALDHLRRAENRKWNFTPINIGTGRGYSVMEVVQSVRDITHKKVEIVTSGRRPGDPESLVANPQRAHDILGWKAKNSSIEKIVHDAWNYTKKINRA